MSSESNRWAWRMNYIRHIKWWLVGRDVAVTLGITYIFAFIAIFLKASAHLDVETYRKLNENGYYAGLIIGFAVSGSLGRRPRPQRLCHLAAVIIGMWVILAVQKIVVQSYFPWSMWVRSIGVFAMMAFMGGGASLMFAPPRNETRTTEEPQQTHAEATSETAPSAASEASDA
jgi:hypothetical protein